MKTRDVIDSLLEFAASLGTDAPYIRAVNSGLTIMALRLERDGIEDFQGTLEEAAGRAAQDELEQLKAEQAACRAAFMASVGELKPAGRWSFVAVPIDHEPKPWDGVTYIHCPGCGNHVYQSHHDFCPACGLANPRPQSD